MRYGTFTINTGTSTANMILASITGKVSYLYFTVRYTNALTQSNIWVYDAITSFSILDSSSTNIVGGQDLPSNLVLMNFCKDWCPSTYTCESDITGASTGQYAYLYSFSSNPLMTHSSATDFGYFQFTGNEQLKVNFASALASPVQVDVYAYVQGVVEQSVNYVKQFNL